MHDGLDDPFRALADPSRRRLLDALYDRDGQTLSDLCACLPHMSRFGVMKHLRLLEDAGLIASRKIGRAKFHYLNTIPIRLISDRWIRKYEPWAGALVEVKTALEASGDRMPEQPPTHVYELYIRASPERLWQAITSPEYTTRYFHGGHYETSWQPGSAYRTVLQDGTTPFEGTILEADPPRRLVYTFRYVGDPETEPEQASRVTWEIQPVGDMCKLSVVHDRFAPGEVLTYRKVGSGWPWILSNLKTLLETGQALPRPLP